MTLYYSSEVSHCTRGRSIPAFTRWSRRLRLLGNRKIPDEHARLYRTSADSTVHPRRHQWSRHRDQTSSERAGGYPDKSTGGGRPAGLSQGDGQMGVWFGDQGARIPFNQLSSVLFVVI